MIIYRAKIRKDLETTISEVERIKKNNDYVYLIKHGYELEHLGKSFEYQALNIGCVFDISELETIEECPRK